jgi:hypothetical protein
MRNLALRDLTPRLAGGLMTPRGYRLGRQVNLSFLKCSSFVSISLRPPRRMTYMEMHSVRLKTPVNAESETTRCTNAKRYA